jgi:hypothetical protein
VSLLRLSSSSLLHIYDNITNSSTRTANILQEARAAALLVLHVSSKFSCCYFVVRGELAQGSVQAVAGTDSDADSDNEDQRHATSSDSNAVVLHLLLTFPQTYPCSPPSLVLCTPLPHPNVFRASASTFRVCLDMLEVPSADKALAYTGWSSSYTTASLLAQLQGLAFRYAHHTSVMLAFLMIRTWSPSCYLARNQP